MSSARGAKGAGRTRRAGRSRARPSSCCAGAWGVWVAEYSSSSVSRPFASAYLAGEAGARAFFAHDFRDPAARVARTRAAASRWVDPRLLAVLRAQQNHLPPSAARSANVEMLARGGTAVVATGQQVGLFLGPLYSLYKAASAVAVARALSAEAGVPCVPLFWLQT
ncbi:MAG: bacillithiol biosynthesis BshC, partial [Myxococcales bacterium]